jgi:hypothetical protein
MDSSLGYIRRHSPLAWTVAVALSIVAAGLRIGEGTVIAGLVLLAVAVLVWGIEKLGRRDFYAYSGLAVLWLWTLALLGPVLFLVYPVPEKNRVYAEEFGFELGPLYVLAIGVCIAVTLVILLARRQRRSLFFICAAAPAALALLAYAPFVYLPRFMPAWQELGTELSGQVSLIRDTYHYWAILPALACLLAALVLLRKPDSATARWSARGLMALFATASALLTFSIVAISPPAFDCGVSV